MQIQIQICNKHYCYLPIFVSKLVTYSSNILVQTYKKKPQIQISTKVQKKRRKKYAITIIPFDTDLLTSNSLGLTLENTKASTYIYTNTNKNSNTNTNMQPPFLLPANTDFSSK